MKRQPKSSDMIGVDTLIVDSFNVIHSDNQLRQVLERDLNGAIAGFISLIESYYLERKVRIYLVFDGQGYSHQHKGRMLSIIYSSASDNADRIIKNLVQKHSAPRGITVVTSDHGIIREVKARGSKVMSGRTFLGKLRSGHAATGAAAGEPSLSPAEIQDWLNYFKLTD
jgi:predicted RNA-binding protein with PIN domain